MGESPGPARPGGQSQSRSTSTRWRGVAVLVAVAAGALLTDRGAETSAGLREDVAATADMPRSSQPRPPSTWTQEASRTTSAAAASPAAYTMYVRALSWLWDIEGVPSGGRGAGSAGAVSQDGPGP